MRVKKDTIGFISHIPGDCIKIANLSDQKSRSMILQLPTGQELTVNSGEVVVLGELDSSMSIRKHQKIRDDIHIAEISIPSLIACEPHLKSVLLAERSVCSAVFKTVACMMLITGSHGPYMRRQ